MIYEFYHPILEAKNQIKYVVQADGSLSVEASLSASNPSKLTYLPRYGVRMAIPEEYTDVEYYGRGPHENYADRNTAAHVGNYVASVEDFYVPYIRPQEHGYRTDVRSLTLSGDKRQLSFLGDDLISFSAHPYPLEDLDPGNSKAQRHTTDIRSKGKVWLHIDYMQLGVGGDDSWTKNGLADPPYRLDPTKCNFSFTIKHLTK